jgi:hypothetical protein
MHDYISEIRAQRAPVRFAFFVTSSLVVVVSIVYLWLGSFTREAYFALVDDPDQRAAFLARQEERRPQLMAVLGGGLRSLTASIGSLMGFDRSDGLEQDGLDSNGEPVYQLPLSE